MLSHYTKLWLNFARTSLLIKLEYKTNFLLQMIIEVCWAAVTFFTLEIMFYQTNSLAGWSKGEVFMIYAIYRLMTAIGAILFRKNISNLVILVNTGELDLLLTKPVNIFFMIFNRIISIDRISQVVISFLLFIYASHLTHLVWSLPRILEVLVLTICGVIIRFGFSIIIHSFVFWFQNLENIERLELNLFGTARFPRQAFPQFLQNLFTIVIPIMFTAAIPAEIILGKTGPLLFVSTIILAIISASITYNFFYFALRHYSSASS